jgi:hypothetical protein
MGYNRTSHQSGFHLFMAEKMLVYAGYVLCWLYQGTTKYRFGMGLSDPGEKK